jgi:hypothetical protein
LKLTLTKKLGDIRGFFIVFNEKVLGYFFQLFGKKGIMYSATREALTILKELIFVEAIRPDWVSIEKREENTRCTLKADRINDA